MRIDSKSRDLSHAFLPDFSVDEYDNAYVNFPSKEFPLYILYYKAMQCSGGIIASYFQINKPLNHRRGSVILIPLDVNWNRRLLS